MKKIETEIRAFDFGVELKSDEKHGTFIEGVPIVFDKFYKNAFFQEKISKTALEKTNLRDVRFLVNHNTDMIPLARSRRNNANSTMQMEVKEDGLHIRVNLDTENNTEAKNLASAVKRGDVSGMSFMYTVDGEKWDNLESDYPTRTITSISQVFEVSAVTFPAYEDTQINVRSKEVLEKTRAALDKAKAEKSASEKKEKDLKEAEARERKTKVLLLSLK